MVARVLGSTLRQVPVVYSGSPVPSVTLREGFCVGNDAKAASDTEAPYEFYSGLCWVRRI